MVGAGPRPLDRGDQPPPILIGVQVANRAAALVGTPLVDLAMQTAPDISFVEGKPPGRGEAEIRGGKIVQRVVRFAGWSG